MMPPRPRAGEGAAVTLDTKGALRLGMEDVWYRRGGAVILRGVNWQARSGEHWAVLGPNGSGKTTLMMIATGYLPWSRGRVFLLDGYLGEIVTPQARAEVGLVSAALTEFMLRFREGRLTGLKVALSGRYGSLGVYQRPSAKDIAQAKAALKRLGVARLQDALFETMSAGEKQLCLIARCYMAESRLIVLDEPCSGLDLAARERLLESLSRSCRERPETPHILVTHHPEEIVPEIENVLLISKGRVAAQGPRSRVLTRERLEAAYETPLRVVREGGRVWILPRRDAARSRPRAMF